MRKSLQKSNGKQQKQLDKKQQSNEPKRKFRLRTIDDANDLNEWLVNKVVTGSIENKTVDAINTIIKNHFYLNGKLKLDYAKLLVQAKVKKIEIPQSLLPIMK